ncbi:MAG: PEP-CTERM sorting domain-containing protein [Planctomycetes bacterium]|nr:PEP-CTERM sorting domain-containing protein [Planctomycetota bacterium]
MIRVPLTLAVVAVVALGVGTTLAGPNTSKPLGPMNLWVGVDGVGTISNDSGAPFTFDGYSIASAGGFIVPANWITMSLNAADPAFVARTGQPAIVFPVDMRAAMWAKMSDTAHLIAEAHLEITATLQPGDTINLGPAFNGPTAHEDLTFTYVNSGTLESFEGMVNPPEPASLALMGLGALAPMRRRR